MQHPRSYLPVLWVQLQPVYDTPILYQSGKNEVPFKPLRIQYIFLQRKTIIGTIIF